MSQTDSSDSEEKTLTPYDRAKQELVMTAWAHDNPKFANCLRRHHSMLIATKYLSWASPDLAMMRFLLERGADVHSFRIRLAYHGSLDIVKPLTEFGFDIKSKGHIILQ